VETNIQLYCNTDETGKITKILTGDRIIPTTTFQYFFMIDKQTEINLDKFCVKNGELVQIDDTSLIDVEKENPTTEQQLAEMKKRLEELEQILLSLSNTETQQ
jgi:hypothetical protein